MKCVTSVTYSVLINGVPSESIQPQRGIRQGDPISPYLYLICTEGLSQMLSSGLESSVIHGFQASRSGPYISHLLFADDSLLFCKATTEECKNLLAILKSYEKISGQAVNYQKSTVTFGKGTPKSIQNDILQLTGITKIGGLGKYLGLPEYIGRNRFNTFFYITQRVLNKMENWYTKLLSPAGKEILLKAVVTAILTYPMSCFMLPTKLLSQLTKAMRQFWWSADPNHRRISWVSREKITRNKMDGGLGIRDLQDFNIALLAKQGWRLLRHPNYLLARVYKAKYYKNSSFLEATLKGNSSFAWKSILKAQMLLKQGTK